MSSLHGNAALVTGASSGIGKAIAVSLLEHGAKVFGMCRRIGKLPPGVVPISCDFRQPERISHAFEILDAATPSLDILINNAGVAYLSRITDGDPAEWAEMWEVNVLALAICCQEGIKRFPSSGGRIVNISSLSGHRVPPTGGFYAPSKFAVRGVTEALRSEFRLDGSSHQVSSVSPGFVATPLVDSYFDGREDELESMRSSMRLLDPGDVAEAVLHIVSAPAHVEVGDLSLRSSDQKV